MSEQSYRNEKWLKIEILASKHKWEYHPNQPNEHMMRFVKSDCMIDVWPTKMTVGTYLKHPRQGKTQLFRRNVSYELLDKIFNNPRQHTGKGYQRKD